jgi:hypothetical protein
MLPFLPYKERKTSSKKSLKKLKPKKNDPAEKLSSKQVEKVRFMMWVNIDN